MKKSFIIAIAAMVLATTVAVVSCKKDDQNETPTGRVASAADYSPGRIDDMNAYLKDFKGRMQNPTRGDDTMLSLEEAAWHLSSVANYDFGNASAEFTDIRYDTILCQVNVTDGMISMADLGTAYAQAADAIDEFYHSLTLENKHFRYIDASISENGQICIMPMTTFDSGSQLRRPFDTVYCEMYFHEDSIYEVFGLGMTELERVLNIIEGRPYIDEYGCPHGNIGRVYYVFSKKEIIHFYDYIDPIPSNSSNYMNSLIFATNGYFYATFSLEEMCHYLSLYHDIGLDLITPGFVGSEKIVQWKIKEKIYDFNHKDNNAQQVGYHLQTITYGRAVMGPGGFEY